MTQLPAIIYFGNDWFAENRTSSHQIARKLARDWQVYYIECPGLRAPKSSGRDLKKIAAKVGRFFRGLVAVEDGLKVATLIQLPLHRFALVRWFNRLFLCWVLRWLMAREGIRSSITWFLVPHLSSVAKRLGERLTVYYCIDDYASLPDVNAEAIRAMDEELTSKADLVFVASATLLEAKRRLNLHTHVSPHGVDFTHFARAQDAGLPVPADVRELPGPVVGFFGLIERWIDLGLIDYLARQRPQYSFVMIGRIAVPPSDVPRRPNLHWLGQRPYQDLPAYGKAFDAAIIPYVLNAQVWHANPIKLREYLAMGKPIVSVSTPEIDKYADVVDIAHSREEFLARLDHAVTMAANPDLIRRRMDRVAGESWDARLEEITRLVRDRLESDQAEWSLDESAPALLAR